MLTSMRAACSLACLCSDSSLLTVGGYVSTYRAALALYSAPGRAATLGPMPVVVQPKAPQTRRSSTSRRLSAGSGGTPIAAAADSAPPPAAAVAGPSATAILKPTPCPLALSSSPDAPCGTHFTSADAGFLLRWLNGCLLRQPLAVFPGDLIAAHGRPLLEAVEGLSGRVLPNKVSGRVPASKKERAVVLFAQVCFSGCSRGG